MMGEHIDKKVDGFVFTSKTSPANSDQIERIRKRIKFI